MPRLLGPDDLVELAPVGHYIALRIGFAFPMEEVNALPVEWVEHYTTQRFMLFDPVIRWVYSNTGVVRWSDIQGDDPRKVMPQAQTFGLRFGAAVSHFDGNSEGLRSFATFVRNDREFNDLELRLLRAYLTRRHDELSPPKNVTKAEREVLAMIRDGKRIKEIAHELAVSEGAIKLRLKNVRQKLGAKTGSQAAALAGQFGLI